LFPRATSFVGEKPSSFAERRCAIMASEPEKPGGLREEWLAVVFIALIVLAVVGFGVKLLLGV
jgi:hypothetical protein